jgi:hypothetical protein
MKLSRYARVALGCLLVGSCLVVASPARAAQTDEQILADMQTEVNRLKQEMHAASDDMERVAELQKQMQALLADAMTKVTPRSRAAMEVSMKVLGPLMEGGVSYTEAVQKYMDAGGFDYASATSAEIIDRRLEGLASVEQLNEGLLKRASSLDADIDAVLKASKLSAAEKAGFLKGFQTSTGGRLGALRAVRTLDARLYGEVRGIYGQLREQLGKWTVEDGSIAFEDDAQVAIYNARLERINVIAERQDVAQRRALGVE